MNNVIFNYLKSGGLWFLIIVACTIYTDIRPLLVSHVRNNHEKSLINFANRIVPMVESIAEASPSDRLNVAINDMVKFANQRGIRITPKEAQSYLKKAKADYRANGGKIVPVTKEIISNNDLNKTVDNPQWFTNNNILDVVKHNPEIKNEIQNLASKER